jgi:hypothetical protein
MFGHIEVEDSSTVMRDDEKALENTKGERRHGIRSPFRRELGIVDVNVAFIIHYLGWQARKNSGGIDRRWRPPCKPLSSEKHNISGRAPESAQSV